MDEAAHGADEIRLKGTQMSIGNHNVFAPGIGADNPKFPVIGQRPTRPKGPLYLIALAFAQFALFVALLGPVTVSMALKAQTLASTSTQVTTIVGNVLGWGALAAVIGNVVFGRLSDRTRSRFGRRRPWIVGGIVVMAISLWVISQAPNALMMGIGWFFAQLGANAAFGPFVATLADQLPEKQYARASAILGIMQSVGILGASFIAKELSSNMLALFMVPALLAAVAMAIFVIALPDPVLKAKQPKLNLLDLFRTFWINPIKHLDFGLAWWSRLLLQLASFMFTSFRLPFVISRLGQSEQDATGTVFFGILIYTITLVVSGYLSGLLSDKVGRRKPFVIASAIIFAVGTFLLMHVHSNAQFYLVEALLGIGWGIYTSVDLALVLQMLPNTEDSGKFLGVFNIANAGAQSLAPFLGAMLLAFTANQAQANYALLFAAAALVALVGAIVLIFIRKVK